MKLKELSGAHLGATITITAPDATVKGMLARVNHWCDMINVTTFGDRADGVTRFAPGNEYVGITIAGWGEKEFPANAECEIEVG